MTSSGEAQTTIHVPGDASTIQAGIDAANNGDTVFVAPGIYNENIDFKGKAITVTSGATNFTAAGATVITGNGSGPLVLFHTNETRASILNGFTIQNGTSTAIYLSGSSSTVSNNAIVNNAGCALVVAGTNASPLIQGNQVANTRVSGIMACNAPGPVYYANPGIALSVLGGDDVQIIGNTFEGNTSMNCGGAVAAFNTLSLLLEGNVIRNNTAACAPAFFERGVVKLAVVQNLVYGNVKVMSQGGQLGGSGSGMTIINDASPRLPATTLTFTDNTLFGNNDPARPTDPGNQLSLTSVVGSLFASTTIENNLFISSVDDVAVECRFPSPPSSLTFTHNDIYNPGPVIHPSGCVSSDNAAGNLTVDPLFIDTTTSNFHTQPTSPVVAAGSINVPLIPPADLDAKAREVCGTIDMGVYEIRPRPVPTLTSSNNPAVGGTSITFTGKVPGNCNIPTGTLNFLSDGKPIGIATLDTSASANVSTATLTVGTHTITATYPGDFNFDSSTPGALLQVVTGYPSSTSVSVAPNPANAFTPITFSSTVTSSYGIPTGSVTFTSGGTTLATATLDAAGHASMTTSSLGAGSYNVVATYGADTNVAASNSSPTLLTVLGTDTVTTLTASPNPASVVQTVSFVASVRAAQGSAIPTGTVTFSDGSSVLGSVPLSAAGSASFNTSTLALGAHTITARFVGSGNFNSSSASVVETINAITTTLALTATPNPANTGQAVTIAATATSAQPGLTVNGLITFRDGATVLGTAALNSAGVASLTVSTLSIGTHPLQGTLAAGSSFGGNSSPVVNEVVLAYDFSLSTSKTDLTIPSGDWSVITVTVTPVGGYHGSVQLACDNLPLYAQCVVDGGNTVSLANGAHNVQVTINTSGVYRYGDQVSRIGVPHDTGKWRGSILAAFLFPAAGLFGSLRCGRRLQQSMLALSLLTILLGIEACSGKYPDHTAPGTYSITLMGADTGVGSTLQHSEVLKLVVPQ